MEVAINKDIVEQWTIPNLNWHQKRAWPLLRKLHREVLITDPRWHFFWEGTYTLIRCSASHTPEVDRFFKEQKIRTHFDGVWKDPHELVRKYQPLFQGMFHGFSELAVRFSLQTKKNWHDKEFWQALDRIVHPFLLMNYHWERLDRGRPLMGAWHNNIVQWWEGLALARASVDRTFYSGYTLGEIRGKDKAAKEQAAKKEGKQ